MMELPTGLQSMRASIHDQAVDTSLFSPLSPPFRPDPCEHEFGGSVHLDVIDPPPRMTITETNSPPFADKTPVLLSGTAFPTLTRTPPTQITIKCHKKINSGFIH